MAKEINRIHVEDIYIPELAIFRAATETQLVHYYEPEPGIFIAESLRVITRAMAAGYEPLSFLLEEGRVEEAGHILDQVPGVPVYVASEKNMRKLTGYQLTGGALCAMRRRGRPGPENLGTSAERIAVLEGITNPTNVGAIFRCAAALGMDGILLTADCSDPLYRRAARVSMGTVFQIPWGYFPAGSGKEKGRKEKAEKADKREKADTVWLKEQGYTTIAMALLEDSLSLRDERFFKAGKLAVILGNEDRGLAPETIETCDHTVYIPMQRGVDSLNVAAAAGVAFWALGSH